MQLLRRWPGDRAARPPAPHSLLRRRRRLLWLLVVTAVTAAAAGWGASTAIRSPADAARDWDPPEPSLVTAPVERRVLASTIVTRGDARFSDSTELVVDVDLGGSGAGGRPVVTGRLPAVGEELVEGAVAVEVSGRPVFLLAGDLPMYRPLGPGTTGVDVRQLEEALVRLGFSPGAVDGVFDSDTAAAVAGLYQQAGYEPAGPAAEDRDRLAAAEEQERAARDALAAAQAALAAARRGPSQVELITAEGEVAIAAEELDVALAERADALAGASAADRDRVRREHDLRVLRAEQQLAVAQARLDELTSPPDATQEQAAVDRAATALAEAQDAVAALRASQGIGTTRGEVVFLPSLPRRVEQVQAAVGDEPAGPVLTLSGAELLVETLVTGAERQLLAVGDAVRLDEASLDIDLTGRIVTVADASSEGTHTVQIRPDAAASGSAAEELTGANVRVTIPVESTDGEVLAVPTAAVRTTVEGTSWVRVLLPDGGTVDVPVRVGLAADGYLEVIPSDRGLAVGDQVVLGLR